MGLPLMVLMGAAFLFALVCLASHFVAVPVREDGTLMWAELPSAHSDAAMSPATTPTAAVDTRAHSSAEKHSPEPRQDPFGSGEFRWSGSGLAPWLSSTGRSLPGTAEAQAAIFAHQNPNTCNCRRQRFFFFRLLNQGLGAEVHLLAWALGMAMRDNLILQLTHSDWRYAAGQVPPTWTRYFLPVTNCTCVHGGATCAAHPPSDPVSKVCCPTQRGHRLCMAHKVRDLPLRESPIPVRWASHPLSWWFAQCTRYLWRGLQPWFASAIHTYRREVVPGGRLPTHVISMHVRRSDKVACYSRDRCRSTEMAFLPFEAYIRAAEQLRRNDSALDTILLTTEDDQVVNETRRSQYAGWRFIIPREERHNWNHFRTMDERGPLPLVRLSVGNLAIHMEAAALVCTMQSNWCRIIDEMRRTTGREGSPVVDLSSPVAPFLRPAVAPPSHL
eukprot:GGOE01014803.1.p1 GENE.GGOE01014803.1~~GGOE01014803.1.p1  ORF type:complete len:444 (+),score=79.04 GGOE01014803.1:105-1436(+)